MTDFQKVESYYKAFNEWNRTFTAEGTLEFEIILDLIKKYTRVGDKVLDLGGGPGRYTIELAKTGRHMSLGDISPELIAIAKEKTSGLSHIEAINVVNAMDLGIYKDNAFDAVVYMGPLYHLTEEQEIDTALKEVHRILKPNGTIIAGFIPRLSGTAGIIERSIYAPAQVTPKNLQSTYKSGIFKNHSNSGFQEGMYLSSTQIERMMQDSGFEKITMRSVRGLGYKLEKGILAKKEEDPELFKTIMQVIEESAENEAIVNTCGNALYIGSAMGSVMGSAVGSAIAEEKAQE